MKFRRHLEEDSALYLGGKDLGSFYVIVKMLLTLCEHFHVLHTDKCREQRLFAFVAKVLHVSD